MKKILRVFTNYKTSSDEFRDNFPNSSLSQKGYELLLNQSGPADAALILGHAQPGMWVEGCPLGIYKLIQDPPQTGFFGRFTRFAPKWADETLTPFPEQTRPQRRIAKHPAVYNWHLGITFDEITSLDFPKKYFDISCIASTKRDLPGHSERFKFVHQLESSSLAIDVYGRGRSRELIEGKAQGLLPYRYSIAIENTSHNDYFTEKVMDCWLTGTVPIYFGAPNLETYFPKESFIQLEKLDFDNFMKRVREGEFSEIDFERRKSAMAEARAIVIEKFSMHALALNILSRREGQMPIERSGKILISDFDSYSHGLRDWAATRLKHA